MKKLLPLLCSIGILSGCSNATKESTTVTPSSTKTATITQSTGPQTAAKHHNPPKYQTLFAFWLECHPPSANCIGGCTVTGKRDLLILNIDQGNGDVSTFFSDPANVNFIDSLGIDSVEEANLASGAYLMGYGESKERQNVYTFFWGPTPVSTQNFVTALTILQQ